MNNWIVKETIPIRSGNFLAFHPIIAKLLFQRNIDTEEKAETFFNPDYQRDLHDPFLFFAMEKALERIEKAKDRDELVAIFGDYDADGVTSSVIVQEALDELKIRSIVYIPDKRLEGYGMNMKAVEELKDQKVSLIITVDCGISNKQEIERANGLGMDVIIVDHHHVPQDIPPALAVINPYSEGEKYPFQPLAGVGVAYKLIQAIYRKFMPEKENQLKWILDLVAIGTIADCVPLVGENRTIVKYGLIVLSKTRRTGIKELFSVGKINIDENNFPDTRKISFQIAPRINAAGRMNHASMAFNLIREKDRIKSRELALEIEASNQKRQKITNQITEEIKILAENSFKDKKLIFAVNEHFPIGIVGLVAGKIADIYGKPVAVIQKGEEESKGSFRSIPELNIIDSIEKCSHLLIKFGGHSQAAGISIANEKLEEFYETLSAIIERELEGKDCVSKIEIDMEIFPKDIDFKLTAELKKFEPFGEGNEEPVFLMRNLIIHDFTVVGNGSKHLKLFLKALDDTPKIFEAIGFSLVEKFPHIRKSDVVDIVFTIAEDEWKGNRKIQLKLADMKVAV